MFTINHYPLTGDAGPTIQRHARLSKDHSGCFTAIQHGRGNIPVSRRYWGKIAELAQKDVWTPKTAPDVILCIGASSLPTGLYAIEAILYARSSIGTYGYQAGWVVEIVGKHEEVYTEDVSVRLSTDYSSSHPKGVRMLELVFQGEVIFSCILDRSQIPQHINALGESRFQKQAQSAGAWDRSSITAVDVVPVWFYQ